MKESAQGRLRKIRATIVTSPLVPKTYKFKAVEPPAPEVSWSESHHRRLLEQQRELPVPIVHAAPKKQTVYVYSPDMKSHRVNYRGRWWMFRGEFYWDDGYLREGLIKSTIMEFGWREDLKAGRLSVLKDSAIQFRRLPMESEWDLAFELDPRYADELIDCAYWGQKRFRHCEQFWSDELDQALVESISRHGVFWSKPFWQSIKHPVRQMLEKHPMQLDALDPDKRWLRVGDNGTTYRMRRAKILGEIGYLFRLYACWRAGNLSDMLALYSQQLAKQSQYYRCVLCGWLFRPCDLPHHLYLQGEHGTDFCHTCLATINNSIDGHKVIKVPLDKDAMTAALVKLVELAGFVPPAGYNSIEFLLHVQRERRPSVLPQVWRMHHPSKYVQEFGSWLLALMAAGVIDEDGYRTGRGTECIALDGHECYSLAEKQIDDWLFAKGIEHTVEPDYPVHPELNPNGLKRADWEVDGVFIEYWGLAGDREYDRKSRIKRKLAKKLGIKLIEVYPGDLQNLSVKLGSLMRAEESGRQL